MPSFQQKKGAELQRLATTEKRLQEQDFSPSNDQLSGGLGLLYRWLEDISLGVRALNNSYGSPALAPNLDQVDQMLKTRPLFSAPLQTEVERGRNGLILIYRAIYLMGGDLFPYYVFNIGLVNRTRTRLRNLQRGTKRKPLFSVNDIAREPGDGGALQHLSEIVRLLSSDFTAVTEAAPFQPPPSQLTPLKP